MANGLVQKQTLQDIANAIRNKNQEVTTYKPSEMAAAINAIASDPKDIALDGNSYQYTTAGKNLVNVSQFVAVQNVDASISGFKFSNNWATTTLANANILNTLQPNTTYTLSFQYKINSRPAEFGVYNSLYIFAMFNGSSSIRLGETNKNTIALNTWSTHLCTFTTPNDLSNYNLISYNFKDTNNTTTGEIEIRYFQIEKGTSASTFEPYTNGASPNPDYPSDVKVVKGKNLFNSVTWRKTVSSGGYPIADNGYSTIVSSGINEVVFTATSNYGGVESDFIKVKANETYTLSFSGTASNRLFATQYNNSKTRISTLNSSTSTIGTTTFTTTTDGYIAIGFNNTSSSATNFSITNIQVEKSLNASEYLPYNNIGVNVVGKNLFSGFRTIGVNTTYNNGTLYVPQRETSTGNYIKANQRTYYFNYTSTYATARWYIAEYDANYTELRSSSKTAPQSFTLGNDAAYFSIIWNFATNTTFPLTISNMMLNEGSNATEYVPYSNITIPVPLNNGFIGKIGDTKDILNIDLESGVISKLKNIDKVVLDGSETWTAYNGTYGWSYYTNTYKDLIKKDFTNLYCLSNYFKYNSSVGDSNIGQFHIGGQVTSKNGNIVFNPFGDATNELANFKTWLGTHNVEVIFAVENPSTEVLSTIDQTTLTNFRNTLKNNGTLTIYSNLDPSQVRITYGYTKTI